MNNNRLLWVNLLKIASIFSVIIIHSSAPLLVKYNESGPEYWWIGNLYNSFSRWCIPVFFMISGAFLIEKAQKESLSRFFFQRFHKIFIPFIFWSGIYYLWRFYGNIEKISLYKFITLLLQEPVYYHLWFIYILIELYLLAPFIGVYVKSADTSNRLFFLAIWLMFGIVLPMLQSCFMFTSYFSFVTTGNVISYLGYFLLGFLLREYAAGKVVRFFFIVLFLLGFFLTACGTFYFTVIRNGGVFSDCFYNYYSVNVLLMSVSIFIFAKSSPVPDWIKNTRSSNLITTIASAIPGIYLIHALVLALLKRGLPGIMMNETMYGPAVGIPLFTIVIFFISCIIVLLIRSIPILKHIVP